jgi:hypothetical protein
VNPAIYLEGSGSALVSFPRRFVDGRSLTRYHESFYPQIVGSRLDEAVV